MDADADALVHRCDVLTSRSVRCTARALNYERDTAISLSSVRAQVTPATPRRGFRRRRRSARATAFRRLHPNIAGADVLGDQRPVGKFAQTVAEFESLRFNRNPVHVEPGLTRQFREVVVVVDAEVVPAVGL